MSGAHNVCKRAKESANIRCKYENAGAVHEATENNTVIIGQFINRMLRVINNTSEFNQ